jgi:D-glycero-D-manno-heptose 1,7-bisphosphate phosphatase
VTLNPPQVLPRRPALFVDKDGTLVENVPYNADPTLLRFQPGACEALAAFAAAGFALVVVSNQSGLALGRFTHGQFAQLRAALRQRLRDEAGVELTGFYYCPHAPAPDGTPACACRKPQPFLLHCAAIHHRLDLPRSWMVGDTLDDVEAGQRAGCHTILYDSGGETRWRTGPLRRPEARHTDWDEVVHTVLAAHRMRNGALPSLASR